VRRNAVSAVVTLLLAAAAAGGVLLFMRSVRDRAVDVPTVDVVMSTRDLAAGEDLDPLIDQGLFVTRAVPRDDLVQGVITDVYQLKGQRTAYPIVAGEQIPAARIAGPLQAGGGVLGIPEGMQAGTLTLDAQQMVGGRVAQGDHVEVFGTFTDRDGGSTTRVVIADALVLAVVRGEQQGGTNSVTLAVTPEQASVLILTQEQGHVWLTLLPPNQAGVEVPAATLRTLR
jgi:pilus assembly protein CpaB